MSHKLIKFAKHKSNESASSGRARSRTEGDSRLHLSRCITNVTKAAGTFIGLMALAVLAYTDDTQAKTYSMTVTIDHDVVDLSVSPSEAGTFAKSSNSTVSVATDNAAGYTLSITGSDDNGRLVNGEDSDTDTNYLSSIKSATTEEQFRALDATSYNNMWGYLPSKWDGKDNTAFLPSPTTSGDVLDHTTTANTEANKYTLAIGARIDTTQRIGSYSNTYVVLATANGTPYTIVYKDNTLSDFPADVSSTADSDKVPISTQKPLKQGYTFIGWCTVAPVAGAGANGADTCGGTTYAAGSEWTIDQTSTPNTLTLYAMWQESLCNPSGTTIYAISCMQDINSSNKASILSSMTEGAQYRLIDSRDQKTYWVSKLKGGSVWMTQNLDLDLSTGVELTSDNTDLTAYGTGAYTTANGYKKSGNTIIWNPANATIDYRSGAQTALSASMTGWTNDNNKPYSVDTGNWYWSGAYYASSNCPSDSSNNYLGCNYATKNPATYSTYFSTKPFAANGTHGHVGNYYNWTAAIATNDSSTYKTATASNVNNNPANSICPAGWRLPRVADDSSVSDFAIINTNYNGGATNTDAGLIASPLFLTRAGVVWTSALHHAGYYGGYWSSTVASESQARHLYFGSGWANPAGTNNRFDGKSLRCLVR